MQARTQRAPTDPNFMNEGLSPKKTAFILVTVIGCIAILWPRVFYPMMFGGGSAATQHNYKEQRGQDGCCDVVLNREEFLNATTAEIGPRVYRKQLNLYTGEMSIRQERPSHMHPESIYQSMSQRGRAIPSTQTVPIVERHGSPSNPPPRIVAGRPGPIPGMRPPMGAGSIHQPQPKGSMGCIMPIYTIGIILFFGYTVVKIFMKKPIPNAPYGPAPSDSNFRRDVFEQRNGRHVEELNGSKLGTNLHDPMRNDSELYNATIATVTAATNLSSSLKLHQQQHHQLQQLQPHKQGSASSSSGVSGYNRETEKLMEIEKLRQKLEDTEREMAKLIAAMNSDQYEAKQSNENSNSNNGDISNGHTKSSELQPENIDDTKNSNDNIVAVDEGSLAEHNKETHHHRKRSENKHMQQRRRRDRSADRSVESRNDEENDMPEPQSIYLEGSLAHDSQILVADSEIKTEEVYDAELNGSYEEPAVVLRSKMTLSLINLDSNQEDDNDENGKSDDIESPLADDIEIIGHDEK